MGYKDQIAEGDLSIHHLKLNQDYNQIDLEDIIPIGERIRDMILLKDENKVLLLLESIPAIGVLEIIN